MPHQEKPKSAIETFSKRNETYNTKSPFHDWKKKMLCTAHTVSPKHKRIMDEAEKVEVEITAEHIATRSAEIQFEHMAKWSADLYCILSEKTEGEAFTVVSNVADMNGLEAWRKLCRRFDARTYGKKMPLIDVLITHIAKARSVDEDDFPTIKATVLE